VYITTGEIWERERAQNLNDLGGKILRITEKGEIPKDNPWKNSPIYSYGNRNPQGLAWHPISGALFSSEHGPSGEQEGWRANDEINIITPGGNYGWPKVYGSASDPKYIDPLIYTGDDTWAPSGICFYTGDKIKEWKNCLLVANLRGNHLKVIHLKSPEYSSVEKVETFFYRVLGRLRDISVGPDGYLYLCTSNTDGRGQPDQYDDLILKINDPPHPDSTLLYD
jgi:glucose/arabinose dehydrogenase